MLGASCGGRHTFARPYLLCDAHALRLPYHVVRHTCLSGIRSACPAGTYGATTGLSAATCSGKCSAGFYGSVAGQTEPTCEGECEAGFMCPAGSVSPTAVPCGSSAVYCPANSGEPTPVSAGYYSVGPTASTVRGMVYARWHARHVSPSRTRFCRLLTCATPTSRSPPAQEPDPL